ncbi:MAG TPA: ThiF family adenylyltransferase [Gemmataceae bacterium]|nr:ThiF family adenylyltransferase [Gemmataceae bacterium]
MAGKFHHEEIFRGADSLARLGAVRLTLCGAGALGSHLADNLTRQGFRSLRVIDRDRVEEHNVSTQLYGTADVGGWKVEVLRNRIFRATGVEIDAIAKELTDGNAKKMFKNAGLVIDTFDNSVSRRLVQEQCRALNLACLHVGLYADYGEIIWDEHYRVPRDVAPDVCDYPLARNLVLLTVAIASESLVRFTLTGSKHDWSVTLADFTVQPMELA